MLNGYLTCLGPSDCRFCPTWTSSEKRLSGPAWRLDSDFRRVNLEILGNTDPFLHAHVWPRFEWEPAELLGKPVWLYPRDRWSDERFRLGPQHDVLRDAISGELDRLTRG